MTARELVGVVEQVMWTVLIVGGPIVIGSMIVGLLVSIFQAATQINEATLTFVPKLLVVAAILMILGPSMVSSLVGLTEFVFNVAVNAGPVNGG
jgi:flagellar biosynthetic protein FliQ